MPQRTMNWTTPSLGEAQATTLQLAARATLDLSAASDGTSPLPRFQMLAYTGSPMRVAGWKHPVILDLAGLSIPSQSRPIRFGHDPLSGVGHTDSIQILEGQLVASGIVSRDTAAAREVVTSSKNGFPWQASVGTSVEEFEFVKANQQVTVNGRTYTGPVNVVRKSTLGEISFVDLGADGSTAATVAAALSSAQQPSVDSDPASHEAGANVSPDDAVLAIRTAALAESERVTTVRRLCTGGFPEIEAEAIREGWSAQQTELAVLRATRPAAPAVHVPDNSVTAAVLEAACLLSAHAVRVEEHFDEPTLDRATRLFHSGIHFQELLLEAAWANGYQGRSFRDPRAVLRAAFGVGVQAAYSVIDMAGLLSNVANKFLLDGFYSVERTWRNICSIRNVRDFKTVTSYRLIGKDQYELVAPGGELKHGTLGNEQYSNKADTYGLMLAIDRRDILNDDLGAITTVPRKLGRGSGTTINEVFWTTFLNNASFFTAGNKNFLAGTDTALSIDGLTKAEVAFLDQTDADGKPIGVMPSIALVPTALSAIGSQLYKSLELRDTTANAKFPVANPHQGKFRVEVSRYLGNARYAGNSTKAWYLMADPADLPVIEVAFLNGQEAPTIETADADFNKLGIQMRGYHDFGVALQDPRGGVKSKGEA